MSHHKRDMPPPGIDFGSTSPNFVVPGNMTHDHIPGSWLGDSGSDSDYDCEDFLDADMTRSKARAIAGSALADLQRAAAEAEDERIRRQTLRERERRAAEDKKVADVAAADSKMLTMRRLASLQREITEEEGRVRSQGLQEHDAAEGRKPAPAVAKSNTKSTPPKKLMTAYPLQINYGSVPTSKARRPHIEPSFNWGDLPSASSTAVPAQSSASSGPTNKARSSYFERSLDSTESPTTSSTTVPAQSNAPTVTSIKPRRSSHIDPSLNSGEQKVGPAPAHEKGFLSLMDGFNARGGAHSSASRRLFDGGFFSEDQVSATAARAKLRADAYASNGEVTPENRLAAARARLATEGRIVATVAQRPSKSGSSAVKGVYSQASVRPEVSQAPATLGNPRLPTRPKMPTYVPTVTAQPGSSTADGVEQPVHDELTIRKLLANKPQPELEAGSPSTGHSVFRTLPIYNRGQAPKSSSLKFATTAAAPTTTTTTAASQSVGVKTMDTAVYAAILANSKAKLDALDDAKLATHELNQNAHRTDFDAGKKQSTKLTAATKTTGTTPSQSVSEKVRAIVRCYGDALNAFDDATVAKFVAHKLKEDTGCVDFGSGIRFSKELTAATKTTGTTSSQSVSEKVQAIVRGYGDAMNAFDDASAAKFVAYKLEEDADFDAGGKHSAKLTAAAKTTATTPSKSVSEKAHAIAHRYASAVKVSRNAAQNVASQKLDGRASIADADAGKEVSTPAQRKALATNHAQGTNGPVIKPDVAETAEVDHDFDVLTSKGPSAANGSPLPDSDLSMNQLDMEFSPTLKGFQGWEDDCDSDDSEEWDLGGLAEWKWVGEKSAQENSAAKRQA